MSENSPVKQGLRSFHPYNGRIKSPLRPVQPSSITQTQLVGGKATLLSKDVSAQLYKPTISSETYNPDTQKENVNPLTNKLSILGTTLRELHRSKSVRKNLSSLGISDDKSKESFNGTTNSSNVSEEPMEVDKGTKGILTERKISNYDDSPYLESIYHYWLLIENRSPIRARYMLKQPDITNQMRSILIDWLIEVGQEYNLENSTTFLAINYIDRFLSQMAVNRNKLQLVGTTAIYIASKLCEMEPPTIKEVVDVTDNTFPKDQILIMEGIMLKTLNFDLLIPTVPEFVQTLCSLMLIQSHITSLANYLSELSLLYGDFLQYKPSQIATAAIALARFAKMGIYWDQRIEYFSKLTFTDIRPISAKMLNAFYEVPTSDVPAIYEKYKSIRYDCASLSTMPAVIPATL